MSEFGKSRPRDYIKSVDLNNGDSVQFVSGGEWVKKDFSQAQDGSDEKTVYVVRVSVNNGDPKNLTINSTSGNSLAEEWGEEGDGWKGKTAKVEFIKMMCFGQMKKVLCLVPTEEAYKEPEPEGTEDVE